MGGMEKINFNEHDALNQFREEIKDIEFKEFQEPHVLLPWLKAQQLDVKSAGNMLRNSLEWRTKMDMDNILEWQPPDGFLKSFPYQICGFDNDGDQFGVVTWNKWDIQGFLDSVPIDRGINHIKYFFQQLEIVKKIMKAHSTPDKIITSGALIVDMEGLAITQFAGQQIISVILETTSTFEANYPYFLKKAIVVNAPKIFTILWSLMKPLLSEATLSTVEIYGFNSDEWKPFLRSILPPEQVPSRYGGSNTTCKYYDPKDGYRILKCIYEDYPENEMKSSTILACQKLDLEFEIPVVNSKLSWAFKTDDLDIGFAVLYNEKEVTDACRVDSHILVQKGCIICELPGKYIVRFDNTFSWFSPKILHYTIKVAPPTNIIQ